MYDMAVDGQKLNSNLTKIANAIREKTGLTDLLEFPDKMVEAINGIETDLLQHRIQDTLSAYENLNIAMVSDGAFYRCTNLQSINVPNVYWIGVQAFAYTGIQKFKTTTTSRVQIMVQAFYYSKIKILDFRALQHIGPYAFDQTVLDAFIIRNTADDGVPGITTDAFGKSSFAGGGKIYVPSSMVEAYKAATNWSTYADQIRAIEDYPEITGGTA